MDGPTVANFVYNKKITTIDPVRLRQDRRQRHRSRQSRGKVGRKLYALGMYDSGMGLFANKKLLKAAGVAYPSGLSDDWTAARFTAAVKKLAARDPDGKSLDIQENAGLDTEAGTYQFAPIVWSAGGALLKNGKAEGAIDSAGRDLSAQDIPVLEEVRRPEHRRQRLRQGPGGPQLGRPLDVPGLHKALGSDLVVLPLPDFGNGPKTGQGSWTWGIGADTKNGKAAGAFLDYLLDDTNVSAMTTANGAPPATKTALAKSPLYKTGGPLQLLRRPARQALR